MNAAERHARKQVLLTRIAFERTQLRRELAQVHDALEPRQLLRAIVGDSLARTIGRALFGADAAIPGDLLGQGLAWLRRYRVAASLLGSLAPFLSGGGRMRRILRVGVIAGAAWLGWQFMRGRRP